MELPVVRVMIIDVDYTLLDILLALLVHLSIKGKHGEREKDGGDYSFCHILLTQTDPYAP